MVSNIYTDFIRVYAQPNWRIDEVEAQWITWQLLGPRGSYHVPVVIRCAPAGQYVDIQYGSGKSHEIVNFCKNHVGYFTIWGRTSTRAAPRTRSGATTSTKAPGATAGTVSTRCA
ncbi:hypothetical protein ACFQX6_29135 [Streptosporangium lutulentum]